MSQGLLTTAGLAALLESGAATFVYMAVGAGDTAPSEAETALEDELGAVQLSTHEVAGNTLTLEGFFGEGAAVGTWLEVGIRDQLAAAGQTLLLRAVLPAEYEKLATNEGIVTVTLTLSNG